MHKLLERQIRKCFGSNPPADEVFKTFVAAIDSAYREGDNDRALLERSIELASSELLERNAQLEQDLEAIKRLELGLFQAEKLRAVGQLAAGIAHELNTPIQYVGDSVYFLKNAFADLTRLGDGVRQLCSTTDACATAGDLLSTLKRMAADIDLEFTLNELPKALEQTTEGLQRVAQIVAAMKEFGRSDQTDRSPTDIGRCIENTLTVARNELRTVADVEVNLKPVPLVFCHPGELGQVILSLLVNAAHAIDDRFRDRQQRGVVKIDLGQVEKEVIVSISDNGCGIPESQKHRIFEPFFTTKPVGKGTGQGLAISRAIMNKQGGELRFESEVGRGTTFYIHVPVAGSLLPEQTPLQSA